jgi:hypothetical protein
VTRTGSSSDGFAASSGTTRFSGIHGWSFVGGIVVFNLLFASGIHSKKAIFSFQSCLISCSCALSTPTARSANKEMVRVSRKRNLLKSRDSTMGRP